MAILSEAVAMFEWPSERRTRLYNQRPTQRAFSDVPETFLRELEGVSAFDSLLAIIMDGFETSAAPEATLAALNNRIGEADAYDGYDDFSRQLVLTLACLRVLRKNPETGIWEHLWALARHSSILEHSLPNAIVSASYDLAFRGQFF